MKSPILFVEAYDDVVMVRAPWRPASAVITRFNRDGIPQEQLRAVGFALLEVPWPDEGEFSIILRSDEMYLALVNLHADRLVFRPTAAGEGRVILGDFGSGRELMTMPAPPA